VWPFFVSLLALCAFTAVIRDPRLSGTAAILLANWLLCAVVVRETGEAYPWSWFFAVDYLAAFVILVVFGLPSVWQAGVGAIYAAQLVCHAARGLYLNDPAALYYGWHFLAWSSWAQIAIVAAWGCCEVAAGRWVLSRSASPPHPGATRASRTSR
jgi:hypothetical protein